MGHVLQPRDGCLELAGQVGILGVAEEPSGDIGNAGSDVEDLVLGDPGQRRAEHDPTGVARGLDGRQRELRSEGQWAAGDRQPLNDNERIKTSPPWRTGPASPDDAGPPVPSLTCQ